MSGLVVAVSHSPTRAFGRSSVRSIRLSAGPKVEGNAHISKIKHCSRVAPDPDRRNSRQVHLLRAELHDELRASGFSIPAGQIVENVTTRDVGLLGLPAGT